MERTEIADAIFELRIKYNVTIDQLASNIDEEPNTVRDWEIGNGQPNADQKKRIITYFQSLGTETDPELAYYKNVDKSITGRFIDYAGGETTKRLTWRALLSGTFKKGHYKGYFNTKTIEDFDINNFQKPFLYLRVFGVLLIIFLLSLLIPVNAIIIISGTIVVPITLFLFTWELNVYHNLKFSKCLLVSLLGGILSIILTLLIDLFVPATSGAMTLWTAINIAVVEEVSKALIVFLFIKKLKVKAILPAIVIGMSVGTGFAVIESCMYAFRYIEYTDIMIQTILLRGVFSIGGHTIWATISASALVKAANYRPINLSTFFNATFLRLFLLPIIFHTAWNFIGNIIVYIILTIIGLSLFIAMINIGLKEASYIKDALDKDDFRSRPII